MAIRVSDPAVIHVSAQSVQRTPVAGPSVSALDLLVVFSGYPQIGVPQSGAAVMSETGLSNIHDITFTRIGGELSPDGRSIAYDNCSSPNRGLYLAQPDGSKAQMVIPISDRECIDVRWSPDSTKLSYSNRSDHTLHVVDIAGRKDTLIPNIPSTGGHWWSPSGKEIVYEQKSGEPSTGRLLHITDLHGNNRQLTFAKDFVPCERERQIDTWAPAWSPKGDKIAFTQCGALFVIAPSGEGLRQLTATRYARETNALPITPVYSPRWSPDGRWIIFAAEYFCRMDQGVVLTRISPDDNTVVDIGRLPYCGGTFSIAPLRK
jgi:Tol biopolymer transport system component